MELTDPTFALMGGPIGAEMSNISVLLMEIY